MRMRADEEVPYGDKCDFCGVLAPVYSHDCPDVELSPGEISIGAWLACHGCHELVLEGSRDELATRCARIYAEKWKLTNAEALLLGMALDVQAKFFDNATGEWEELK